MTDTEIESSVVDATIDGVLKQYKDGSWAIRVLIDPHQAQTYLKHMSEIGTRVAIAKLGKPETAPAPADQHTKQEMAQMSAQGKPVTVVNRTKGPWGHHAKLLRLNIDWMGNPKVWEAFGTDDEYREWIRSVGCIAGQQCFPACSGDVVAAHVRRIANGAGGSIKPPFSCVPLCDGHHRLQHQHGESHFDAAHPEGGGKSWFDKKRIELLHAWLWRTMKQHFGVESMSALHPKDLREYAAAVGIDQYLPECYRE